MDVIDTIEELLNQYPAPTHLRMDNGPEFIAHALQEWCTGSGSGAEYIPPVSPWVNPFVESFNSRLRDEFLQTKSAGGHLLSFLDHYRKQSYWQNSTGWSTIHTDRTRLSRGVRL
jgi:transposase InsO family protein